MRGRKTVLGISGTELQSQPLRRPWQKDAKFKTHQVYRVPRQPGQVGEISLEDKMKRERLQTPLRRAFV